MQCRQIPLTKDVEDHTWLQARREKLKLLGAGKVSTSGRSAGVTRFRSLCCSSRQQESANAGYPRVKSCTLKVLRL